MKEGQTFKVDSYNVKQYENERFVDIVTVVETPTKRQKTVLCYSPKYMANVLISKIDLK